MGRRFVERDVGAPEVAQRRRAARVRGIRTHHEGFRALLFRGSGGLRIVDRGDDGDPVTLGDRMAEEVRHTWCGLGYYWPIGCQTVFSSRKLEISQGLCASARPRTTRLTFSAESRSSSADWPAAPPRALAFTSRGEARTGPSSARKPVSRLTTPPGRSLVAIASASSTAAIGCASDATATTGRPPTDAASAR